MWERGELSFAAADAYWQNEKKMAPLMEFFIENPPPIAMTLPQGFELYKFSKYAGYTDNLSEFWSSTNKWHPSKVPGVSARDAMVMTDIGLAARRERAKAMGSNLVDYARQTSAVKKAWSDLKYIIKIKLARAVPVIYGGIGFVQDDPEAYKKSSVSRESSLLSGTGFQFFIPDFKADDVENRIFAGSNTIMGSDLGYLPYAGPGN